MSRQDILDEGCLLDDLHDRIHAQMRVGLPVSETLAHRIHLALPHCDLGLVGTDKARHRTACLTNNPVENGEQQINTCNFSQRLAVIGRHAATISCLYRQDFVEWHRCDLQQFLLRFGDRRIIADGLNHALDERGNARTKRFRRWKAQRFECRIEALVGLIAIEDLDRAALRAVE